MLNKYLIKNDEKVAYRELEDEIMIVDLEKSTFHVFNPVGAFIWNHADGKTTIDEIITKMLDEFEIDKETAKLDSVEFIEQLLDAKMAFISSIEMIKCGKTVL